MRHVMSGVQRLPRPNVLAISGSLTNLLTARLSLPLLEALPTEPIVLPTMLPRAVMPLPDHRVARTDALFSAVHGLQDNASSALDMSGSLPSSLSARLSMLGMLPTRLTRGVLNGVWSLLLMLLEVLPKLLMLLRGMMSGVQSSLLLLLLPKPLTLMLTRLLLPMNMPALLS